MTTTLELARQLLGFNTINPPGSEADCMRYFADWLNANGFAVRCRHSARVAAI
ncbi:acetylornithine deacetylase [Klebsiella grimontii]|uniref:Acetylornithine deacetylase n=1 Tax=Klebsiella grimontii TaxID=2058152 RepID=A0A7H4P3P5_9ENTR|nr:acetylornithine deacetylase [Klebsiella grimontii]